MTNIDMTQKQTADALAAMKCKSCQGYGKKTPALPPTHLPRKSKAEPYSCLACSGTGALFPLFRMECECEQWRWFWEAKQWGKRENPTRAILTTGPRGNTIYKLCTRVHGNNGVITNPDLYHETRHQGLVMAATKAAGWFLNYIPTPNHDAVIWQLKIGNAICVYSNPRVIIALYQAATAEIDNGK